MLANLVKLPRVKCCNAHGTHPRAMGGGGAKPAEPASIAEWYIPPECCSHLTSVTTLSRTSSPTYSITMVSAQAQVAAKTA